MKTISRAEWDSSKRRSGEKSINVETLAAAGASRGLHINEARERILQFRPEVPPEEADYELHKAYGGSQGQNECDKRKITSPQNGKNGGRPPAPSPADVANLFADERLRDKEGKLTLRYWRGQWYRYKEGRGWCGSSEDDVKSRVMTFLRNKHELKDHAKRHYRQHIMANLHALDLCGVEETVEMPCFLDNGKMARSHVAFSNGLIVDLLSYARQLAEKKTPSNCTQRTTPDFFSTDSVSYPWEPDASARLFHRYLERVQPDPQQRSCLQRMLGVLMIDMTRFEVFWQLYGNGANGKTVLLDIIKELVGRRNISYVALSDLFERFQEWPLATAKVNICGELPTDMGRAHFHRIEGRFKDLVSGGEIEVEKKGADKYNAKCRARFVMATNSLPTFFDKSDAIWRRLRIIPFPVEIPEHERDPELAQKIISSELPGVMAWALDGLAEVINANRVADCPEGERIKRKHRFSCDQERQFLTTLYVKDKHNRIKAKPLYDRYRGWMQDNGHRPCVVGKFYDRVEQVFPGANYKVFRIDGKQIRGFEGIKEANVTDVTGC